LKVIFMRAYVLVDCSPQDIDSIVEGLQCETGVIMVDRVNGPHPVVCVVESEETTGLADKILFHIRKLPGVKDITVYLTEPKYARDEAVTGHYEEK
jgi:nitrate reductase NapAB chaperone NapD